MIEKAMEVLKQVGHSFRLEPFASMAQSILEETLAKHKKDKYRKGTILTPLLTIWLVLALTLRRDLNYHKTLNWLISGFRWKSLELPPKILKDGAISHARGRIGVDVFHDIFYRLVSRSENVKIDFHGSFTLIQVASHVKVFIPREFTPCITFLKNVQRGFQVQSGLALFSGHQEPSNTKDDAQNCQNRNENCRDSKMPTYSVPVHHSGASTIRETVPLRAKRVYRSRHRYLLTGNPKKLTAELRLSPWTLASSISGANLPSVFANPKTIDQRVVLRNDVEFVAGSLVRFLAQFEVRVIR